MDGAGSERRRGGGIKQEVLYRNPVQFSPPPETVVIPALDAGIFFISHLQEYDKHFHIYDTQPPADPGRFCEYLLSLLQASRGCVLCSILCFTFDWFVNFACKITTKK